MGEVNEQEVLEMQLEAGADDWQPTPHGEFLARVLARNDLVDGKRVLELGAGVGNHTVVLLRQGARSVVATEVHADLLETTRANVEANCPGEDRVEYRVADWLNTDGTFDVIVTNPPFCKSGKQNRRYFIDSLILDAHKRLEPGGELVFVQSSMADLGRSLEMLDRNGFDARVLDATSGPFRDYYFEDAEFMDQIQHVPGGFEVRDGQHYETLYVLHGRLRPYTPPVDAHVV